MTEIGFLICVHVYVHLAVNAGGNNCTYIRALGTQKSFNTGRLQMSAQ